MPRVAQRLSLAPALVLDSGPRDTATDAGAATVAATDTDTATDSDADTVPSHSNPGGRAVPCDLALFAPRGMAPHENDVGRIG